MKRKYSYLFKLVSCLLLMAMAVTMFAGCKKENDGKIVISAEFDDEKTNPEGYNKQMEIVRKFEEKYPNVKVENAHSSFSADTFMTKAEAGTLPTVFYVPLTEANKIMDLELAADLTAEFEKRGIKNSLSDYMLSLISKNDKIYAFPSGCYDTGIAVNIDLYKKAGFVSEDGTLYQPKDWNDFARVAKQIKDTTGVDGFIMPTTGNVGGWRFTPIAWSNGVVFETKQADGSWKATFNSEECIKTFQYISDLKWKYDVLPDNALISMNNTIEQFAAGNVAMTFAESGLVAKFTTQYGMSRDNIGVIGIPAGDKKRVSLMGGSLFIINKDATPEQIEAALNYLEFQGKGCSMDDEKRENLRSTYEAKSLTGEMIGLESITPWTVDSDYGKFVSELDKQYLNVDVKQIENYNNKSGLEFQEEEPIDAQALYAVLDSILQEILTNKNADIRGLVSAAASDFQRNNLDYAR